MYRDECAVFGRDDLLVVEGRAGIRLPNGLHLQYPNLRRERNEDGDLEWVFDRARKGRAAPSRLWGSALSENISQSLARIIIGIQMIDIVKRFPIVMTVHDSVVSLAPTEQAEEAKAFMVACMRRSPSWAPGLPLNCECGYGPNYGECK